MQCEGLLKGSFLRRQALKETLKHIHCECCDRHDEIQRILYLYCNVMAFKTVVSVSAQLASSTQALAMVSNNLQLDTLVMNYLSEKF